MEIFACLDKNDCLTTDVKTVKVNDSIAFKKKVENLLTSIEGKLRSEKIGYSVSLSNEEKNLLNLIRFPVFKIMQTSIASAKNGDILNAFSLAEISANDILQKYTEDVIETISKSLLQFKSKTMNVKATQEMISNITDVRNFIEQQSLKNKESIEFTLKIIMINKEFEKVLANEFADSLGQVLQFSNQLNNRY